MLATNRFQVNLLIIRKKILSAKAFYLLGFGLAAVIAYVWAKDSISTAFKFFLFLFPHFFLFTSNDMMKDEIENGMLESIIFINGEFKNYLFQKNIVHYFLGMIISLASFLILAISGLITGNFSTIYLLQFLAGTLIGAYYVSLSGWLSFYFKGGSNVMIVIIAQLASLIGLFLSATQKAGFIDQLEKGSFPTLVAKLKFMGVVLIFPDILSANRYLPYCFLPMVFACVFLALQWQKLRGLELKKQ
jgi:hypothetical protein